jgi:hypothetical protein
VIPGEARHLNAIFDSSHSPKAIKIVVEELELDKTKPSGKKSHENSFLFHPAH